MWSGSESGSADKGQKVFATKPEACERLSALLDGELDAAELDALLRDCAETPALGQAWSRLCGTKAIIEGARLPAPPVDITAAVMAGLDDAPVAAEAPSKVVQFPGRMRSAPQRMLSRRVLRPAYGMAAAASIAAVALVTAFGLHKPAVPGAPTAAPASNLATLDAQPVAMSGGAQLMPVALKETGWSQIDPESARLLDDYVIEHSNYRTLPGMGGSLSYARFAAYTATPRPANGSR